MEEDVNEKVEMKEFHDYQRNTHCEGGTTGTIITILINNRN